MLVQLHIQACDDALYSTGTWPSHCGYRGLQQPGTPFGKALETVINRIRLFPLQHTDVRAQGQAHALFYSVPTLVTEVWHFWETVVL